MLVPRLPPVRSPASFSRTRSISARNRGSAEGGVFVGRSKDAPDQDGCYECHLEVVGMGVTPAGDGLAEATGQCTRYGNVT